MIKENQKIFVRTANFRHGKGTVFYASLPCDSMVDQRLAGLGTNGSSQRHHLVSGLLDHLAALKNPLRMPKPYGNQDAFPVPAEPFIRVDRIIRIIRGPLGKPELFLGEDRRPAISFCQSGQTVWAAMCGDEHDIGIDVAEPHDFEGKYPFSRVFNPPELQHALKLLGQDLKKAAALLWSIKEAVAKAMGCAFHLVDPRQMMVYPSIGRTTGGTTDGATGGAIDGSTGGAAKENGEYDFPVGLLEKAVMRFPMAAGRVLWVRSVFHGEMWLSIALLNWQSQRGESYDPKQ
ncbi:MAG: 4'-phosphopantetheinyl transferase superfamily protein [Desulfamplus sp.]|nr:4'-phosphopantetheinyl transferase superfamily protein [Desulfamplus sp.]